MSICLDSVCLVVPSIKLEDKVLKNFNFNGVQAQEKELLTDINLSLENGTSYGLLGSNGAGKTTLLKVLMGLYAPTKGKITTEGTVHGTVTTLGGYHPELSVFENLVMRALVHVNDMKLAKEIAFDVLSFADINVSIHEPFKNLSSGNQLRVGFAYATSLNADNLLLDEIVAVGDYRFIQHAKKRLKNYLDETTLFVLSSHVEDLQREFCEQGIVLKSGRIVYKGEIDDAIKIYHSKEYESL